MALRAGVSLWIKNFIYGLLVFCIGGVGSLTFFDAFSPYHGPHAYHLTFGDVADHVHNPLPPPVEVVVQLANRHTAGQLAARSHLMGRHGASPGLVQFFQLGLSHGYLLATARFNISWAPTLFASVSTPLVTGHSAWLSPPEKPPKLT